MTRRFESREPRVEDLARIRELEDACRELDRERKKAVEDMKYFKLELVNREENYNKTFGRQPLVGLMGKPSTTTPTSKPGPTFGMGGVTMNVAAQPTLKVQEEKQQDMKISQPTSKIKNR